MFSGRSGRLNAIGSTLSNFISALAGGGAGLLQLPALLFFGLPFSKALATHKVASVALGLGASIPHLKGNNLQRKYVVLILVSGIPGVLCGAYSASIFPSDKNHVWNYKGCVRASGC